MTEDEAIKRLNAIYAEGAGDDERLHSEEDQLLLEIIRDMKWTGFLSAYHAADHCRWCA